MNNLLNKSLVVCKKDNSGLFYKPKAESTEVSTPSESEFESAVKKWKKNNAIKSLRRFASNPKSQLSSFYKNPLIGKYLSRREIIVNEDKTLFLNKYEKSLYSALATFSGDVEYQGQIISYRCNKVAGKSSNSESINLFFSGLDPMDASHILEVNAAVFNELKIKKKELYKGVHYLSFSFIIDRYLSNLIKNVEEGGLTVNEGPYFFLNEFLTEIESGKIVKFDDCPFNVVLHQYAADGHAIAFVYLIDTQNQKKPKVIKVIGFNSWEFSSLGCPIALLEKSLNKFRKKNDPIEIIKIYYGAQIFQGNNILNKDGCCGQYATNTLNAIAKLLIQKESLFHKRLLEGIKPTLKEQLLASRISLIMSMIVYTVLSYLLLAFELCFITLSPMTRIITLLISTLGICYPFDLFGINTLIYDPLKEELKEMLPQYFYKKNGMIHVRSFEDRRMINIKDRWLTGNVVVEGFMENKIKKYPFNYISMEKSYS